MTNKWAWEEAKAPTHSPRSAGAIFDGYIATDEEQRRREADLQADLQAVKGTGEADSEAAAMHRLGLQLESMGALLKAEGLLADARDLLSPIAVSSATLAVRNDHGVLLSRLGRVDEAESSFRTVVDADPKGEEADQGPQRSAGHNLAVLYASNGRYEDALKLWDREFRRAREQNDAGRSAALLIAIGVLRLQGGHTEEAMQLFNRGVLLAQRGGDLRTLAYGYNNIGLIFSGPTMGDHIAAIPFAEMSLGILAGPTDLLARLYVLNNNIIVYEQAHLEPARRFRSQLADTLRSFSWAYPRRSDDVERALYGSAGSGDGAEAGEEEDEWQISPKPALLNPLSRLGCSP